MSSVYSKITDGKIKEVATIEREFDIEEIKKHGAKIEADIQKTETEYKRMMGILLNEKNKVNEILAEAAKLGINLAQPPSKSIIATKKQVEKSIKAETAAAETK